MKLHLTFRNLHRGVVRVTQTLMEQDLWTGDPESTLEHLQNWCDCVCGIYEIPRIQLQLLDIETVQGVEGGLYDYENDIVALTRPSTMWLFHQFRHHMQANGLSTYSNLEVDAIGWASSLMHVAAPQHFCMLVTEGLMPSVTPGDLLPEEDGPQALSEAEQAAFDEMAEGLLESLEPGDDLLQLMEDIANEGDTST
jgi:hypothetical protein